MDSPSVANVTVSIVNGSDGSRVGSNETLGATLVPGAVVSGAVMLGAVVSGAVMPGAVVLGAAVLGAVVSVVPGAAVLSSD